MRTRRRTDAFLPSNSILALPALLYNLCGRRLSDSSQQQYRLQ